LKILFGIRRRRTGNRGTLQIIKFIIKVMTYYKAGDCVAPPHVYVVIVALTKKPRGMI
jgi:hypothetical protein